MTIQDISYIMTIMEEMSITKAADRLFLSQPSLSKCIKKVENEYGITLFHRAKGSSLVLTEAGRRFREMGISVLQQHQLFVHQMEQLKSRNDTNIVFGATMQRAYDMSGPVMKWIFENAPGYSMELKTLSSSKIPQELIAGNLDIAVVPNQTPEPELYFLPLVKVDTYLFCICATDPMQGSWPSARRDFPTRCCPSGQFPGNSLSRTGRAPAAESQRIPLSKKVGQTSPFWSSPCILCESPWQTQAMQAH